MTEQRCCAATCRALNRLPAREAHPAAARDTADGEMHTLEEVGKAIGVTRSACASSKRKLGWLRRRRRTNSQDFLTSRPVDADR
jgi:DNA-directed RNA polymerase sigma subunit (sigma70/sigma32)